MNPLWSVLFVLSPLPILILVGRLRVKRQRRAAGASIAEKKPFEPSPEPEPNLFFRYFSSIERVYIRQQIPTARVGSYIVSWLVFCAMTPSLFPSRVLGYQIEQSQSITVWNSYLRASVVLGWFSTMIAIVTAVVAGVGLTGKVAQTAFFRTRPITYRMLFWGRVLPALGALLAGYAAGFIVSLALLAALYGPVWNHLNASSLGMLPGSSHSYENGWLLRSPWAIFTSIAVSMIFIFSTAMALALLPLRIPKMPKPVAYLVGFVVYMTFSFLAAHRLFPTLARFGLIPGSSIAPPPLFIDLVPLALSTGLLWIAQEAASRKEN